MGNENTLSKTTVKINNIFFSIVQNSFKTTKGYGSVESVPTIGEGGKIIRNIVEKIEDKFSKGSFEIINNQKNQDAVDTLMAVGTRHALTIEGIDPNGAYKPITNASIVNDPEWVGGGDSVTIEFEGDAMEG